MHATRDTGDVIKRNRAGGRVMRGVMRLPLLEVKELTSQEDVKDDMGTT